VNHESQSPQTPLIIAIDGPAGAGKSTVARLLAGSLGIPCLDTGAMYRAVGILARRHGILPPYAGDDAVRIVALLEAHDLEFRPTSEGFAVFLDGEEITTQIRSPEASELASAVSALTPVRRALVPLQRRMAEGTGGVAEGRDVGSVVFPDARLKVFLTASAGERARRRWEDLRRAGCDISLEEVQEQQRQRDLRDTTRSDSPLMIPEGAVVLDTTQLGLEGVVARILRELGKNPGSELDSSADDTVRSRNHGRLAHE